MPKRGVAGGKIFTFSHDFLLSQKQNAKLPAPQETRKRPRSLWTPIGRKHKGTGHAEQMHYFHAFTSSGHCIFCMGANAFIFRQFDCHKRYYQTYVCKSQGSRVHARASCISRFFCVRVGLLQLLQSKIPLFLVSVLNGCTIYRIFYIGMDSTRAKKILELFGHYYDCHFNNILLG